MDDDIKNKSQPLILKDRLKTVASEHTVGGHYEGESNRERSVGKEREVVVDVLKRNVGPARGTYFLRVSLRSMVRSDIISRFEIDIDRYSSEADLLQQVMLGGASVAIADIENRGATWDPDYVAHQAVAAAKELFAELGDPDKTRGA